MSVLVQIYRLLYTQYMRVLILQCDALSYTLKSFYGTGVDDSVGRTAVFEEVTLAFVAVEPGDQSKVNAAAKRLRKAARDQQTRHVVLGPFAHLSQSLAKPDEAIDTLNQLADRLRSTLPPTVNLDVAPFGWHKSYRLEISGELGSQSFFEATAPTKEPNS